MKKIFLILVIILFTGCGNKEFKTVETVSKNANVNIKNAENVLVESKAFTINDDKTELLLELTNKDNDEVYIKSIKINFCDSTGKVIYTQTEKINKNFDSNEVYDINVVCNKSLVETADFKYELVMK